MLAGRFLFVTWSGGGNTAPTYPLVRRLVARGHEVTVLGQAAQSEATRGLGATFVPIGVPEWTPGRSLEDEADVFLRLLFGPAVGRAVLEQIQQNPPSVIVVDCMLTSALAAAEHSKIPSAALVHVLYQQLVHGMMGRMWEAALGFINETRSGLGIPPVKSPLALMAPMNAVLVACPQEFDAPMTTLSPNVRYVGAILDDAPSRLGRSPWPGDDGRPHILVAFSSTYQHQEEALRRIAAALADLPVQAVITLGSAVDLGAIGPATNVALHRFIPHRELLPECALVVTHAGLGAVMASLAHGVPLLCMPMGREQGENASRVAACGAGEILAADATIDQLRDSVRRMLGTPSYRDAARRMAAIIASQDGVSAAVAELEKLTMLTVELGTSLSS
jgi:MGT family glycosyltransferase